MVAKDELFEGLSRRFPEWTFHSLAEYIRYAHFGNAPRLRSRRGKSDNLRSNDREIGGVSQQQSEHTRTLTDTPSLSPSARNAARAAFKDVGQLRRSAAEARSERGRLQAALGEVRHFFDDMVTRHAVLLEPYAYRPRGKTLPGRRKQGAGNLALSKRDRAILAILAHTSSRAVSKLRGGDFYNAGDHQWILISEVIREIMSDVPGRDFKKPIQVGVPERPLEKAKVTCPLRAACVLAIFSRSVSWLSDAIVIASACPPHSARARRDATGID